VEEVMYKMLLLIACLALSLGVMRSKEIAQAHVASQDDDYAVYSALINQKYITDRIKLVVIQDETVAYSMEHTIAEDHFKYVSEQLAPILKETFDDYMMKNETPWKLNRQLSLKVKYVLMRKEDIDNTSVIETRRWYTRRTVAEAYVVKDNTYY
jgi:hypothetical protein